MRSHPVVVGARDEGFPAEQRAPSPRSTAAAHRTGRRVGEHPSQAGRARLGGTGAGATSRAPPGCRRCPAPPAVGGRRGRLGSSHRCPAATAAAGRQAPTATTDRDRSAGNINISRSAQTELLGALRERHRGASRRDKARYSTNSWPCRVAIRSTLPAAGRASRRVTGCQDPFGKRIYDEAAR